MRNREKSEEFLVFYFTNFLWLRRLVKVLVNCLYLHSIVQLVTLSRGKNVEFLEFYHPYTDSVTSQFKSPESWKCYIGLGRASFCISEKLTNLDHLWFKGKIQEVLRKIVKSARVASIATGTLEQELCFIGILLVEF